jgi:hypothetical protein
VLGQFILYTHQSAQATVALQIEVFFSFLDGLETVLGDALRHNIGIVEQRSAPVFSEIDGIFRIHF